MSANQTYTLPSPRLTRRTSMACLHCRQRKVKCRPTDEQLGRRCERCIKANLECKYVPVAAQETQTPSRDQDFRQGNFVASNSGVTDHVVPLSITDQSSNWTPSTSQEISFDAWPPVDVIIPPTNSTVYGASSHHGQYFQQGVYRTHDGSQPASDSHAVDSWFDQAHESHYYQPREIFPPSAFTGSSSADTVNYIYNQTVSTEFRCWPDNHDQQNCRCSPNCQCHMTHQFGGLR